MWHVGALQKRILISVVSGLSALAVLLGAAIFTGRLIPNSGAAGAYPIRGVDVSHHQGTIDWPVVALANVDFAYIKATEGGDLRDDQFANNWKNAAAYRIPRGAYHYFTFRTSGASQADNFLSTVPIDSSALPPAVDLEFGGNASTHPSVSEFQRELTDFLSRLRHTYKKEPVVYTTVVYTTDDFYAQYLSDYPIKRLWIRSTLYKPRLPPGHDWFLWQFTDRGHVRGIQTPVDLSVYYGNRAAFDAVTAEEQSNP